MHAQRKRKDLNAALGGPKRKVGNCSYLFALTTLKQTMILRLQHLDMVMPSHCEAPDHLFALQSMRIRLAAPKTLRPLSIMPVNDLKLIFVAGGHGMILLHLHTNF